MAPMKMIEYRVHDNQQLIDAVFEGPDGTFWHFQRIGPRKVSQGVALARVVFAELPGFPTLGVERADYQALQTGGLFGLDDARRWYELILSLLQVDDGWHALAATFVLA